MRWIFDLLVFNFLLSSFCVTLGAGVYFPVAPDRALAYSMLFGYRFGCVWQNGNFFHSAIVLVCTRSALRLLRPIVPSPPQNAPLVVGQVEVDPIFRPVAG